MPLRLILNLYPNICTAWHVKSLMMENFHIGCMDVEE